ncbi:PREDICTED: nardilysin-like isoform X2 [Camelina sativa]|uniref:Nardilysin-like isoform X2 n=1 Tax=Camelina sativa TaxID=90675 RepID=A0ABM0TTA7_CAMSA|nr:PREDICTED: nardilysin-like isoform X2 [Camelina sativa]
MRIDLISSSFKAAECRTEPWFKSRFIEEQIPLEFIQMWNEAPETSTSLKLSTSENQFIPSAIKLRVTAASVPKCIVDNSLIKMWHKCNGLDLSYVYLCINLNGGKYSVGDQLMMDLFTELLRDDLDQLIFEGKKAKISSSLSISDNRLMFQVKGYREKLHVFFSELWKKFKSFSPKSKRFEIIKEQVASELNNMDIKTQSEHLLLPNLYEGSYGVHEKLNALAQITFDHLESFIRALCSQVSIEGLCYGDVLEKEAVEISEFIERTLEGPTPPKVGKKRRIVCVPHRVRFRRDANAIRKSANNSIAKVYFRIGRKKDLNEELGAMLALFDSIVDDLLFDQLRTQEHLGYELTCDTDLTGGVCGFYIYVVSSRFNPNHLLRRIYNFVTNIRSFLENMEEEIFEDYIVSTSFKLFDGLESTWNEIVCQRYKFKWHKKEQAELIKIQKEDLIKWYNKYFVASSHSCRRVAVCIWGSNTNKKNKKTCERNLRIFKKLQLSSTKLRKMKWLLSKR